MAEFDIRKAAGTTPETERDYENALRPLSFDSFSGQREVVENLKVFVMAARMRQEALDHVLLHGPPGLGKTTLSNIIANELSVGFKVTSGPVLDKPGDLAGLLTSLEKNDVLFIDEIHRFSKSQQDSLLGAVETGIFTLIGATTENPSFEVITPLLSRCQVYVFRPLERSDMEALVDYALKNDTELRQRTIEIAENEAMLRYAGGDARKLLNILELIVNAQPEGTIVIDNKLVEDRLQQNPLAYDKDGEMHYDIISAFIKSVRGSDPDAAVYWLARMIAGGEDVKFIARRLIILAAEDIGLANPNALLLANACFEAVHKIGLPEARIPLAETTVYLATSPKSNSAYMAIGEALALVEKTGNLPVPLHLRNAPTKLMKELNYGKEYKYAHDYEGNFVKQKFLPDEVDGARLWTPQNNPAEAKIREHLRQLWGEKFN